MFPCGRCSQLQKQGVLAFGISWTSRQGLASSNPLHQTLLGRLSLPREIIVSPERKHIRVVESDELTVVRFNNIESLFRSDDTIQEVSNEFNSLDFVNLVVDFEKVDFEPRSHFFAALRSLYVRAKRAGGSIALYNLPLDLEKFFRNRRFDAIFELRQTDGENSVSSDGWVVIKEPTPVDSPRMHIRITEEYNGFIVVTFNDIKCFVRNCPPEGFHSEFHSLVGRNVILDFENIDFPPTAWFFGQLVSLHKKSEKAGRVLAIYNLPKVIMECFEISRLSSLFNIFETDEGL